MRNVWVMSDLHLGHHNIIKYQKSRNFANIDEHDDFIIDNINERVRKHDTLIITGDVAFTQAALFKLNKLKVQTKRLVLGNHDRFTKAYPLVFSSIHGVYEKHNIIFTHVPVHQSQFERYMGNIHGHLHHTKLYDKYFNACIDQLDELAPIKLTDIMEILSEYSQN